MPTASEGSLPTTEVKLADAAPFDEQPAQSSPNNKSADAKAGITEDC